MMVSVVNVFWRVRDAREEPGSLKSNMSVGADTAHEEVDAAVGLDFLFIAFSFRLNFVADTPNRFNILRSIGSIVQFLAQMPDMHSNCAAVFRVVFIFPNCMKQFLNTYNIPRQRKLTSFPMMMWKKAHSRFHMRITSDLSNIRKRKRDSARLLDKVASNA